MKARFILFCVLFTKTTFAEFNKHFADFIEDDYGKTFLNTLQRSDLGDGGSFGGKSTSNDEILNDPVIFVHGVSDIAGGKMQALSATYKKHGYGSGELYATTYDSGSKNNPIAWADYSLKCEHVKQIRTFILAVKYYTQRNVDVVAYSLGVPIARKAILGGECVDTREDLGQPLTQYVDTFVGVAGPNHGISLQVAGVSIPGCVIGAIPILPICSRVIGLYSGLCPTESDFLTDINEKNHYEGKYVFTLYTETDEWIGYKICDKITARIPGEDGHRIYKKYSHDEIILRTCDTQIEMMQSHTSPSDVSEEPQSQIKRALPKSRQTRKRNIEDYDYLSELSSSNFETAPQELQGSSKMSQTVIPTTVRSYETVTRSYESSYLPPRIVKSDIDMINARPYQFKTTQSDYVGDKVGGYHTHVNVSFD
ncbi:Lipase [Caenorhabditis elegans]|uniref:Lipase n=1 Tax=Caenorhabditis elegans TaxID=6239 RepID=Q19941_CAEEL|nr:Lipase [Caenorhabditis elegans]CAA93747.1 Lipase [Caenorhabditis elegans]|eukprot:NP_510474.1 LIPaSe related [Caenorhabditis elegans]